MTVATLVFFPFLPSGKVEIFANVIESKIQDIKIYGDFFGIEDVAAVEDVLVVSNTNVKMSSKPFKPLT